MSVPIFSAEDIRQYYYCKRVIYYRYVLRARVRETYKMRKGREKHNIPSNKIVNNGTVLRNVYLCSEDLGLVAVVDVLVLNGNYAEIIELKAGNVGKRKMLDSHKAQLAAQAILVERVLGLRVKGISVLDATTGECREVKLVNYHREMVLNALDDMRRIVEGEVFPDAPIDRGKCIDCEFRCFCADL